MASFSSSFGLTESDSEFSIENSLDNINDSKVYNGYGKNDQKTWGDAVNENNGRLEFSKKNLFFTFELERSSINEMSALSKGNLILTNSNNKNYNFPLGNIENGKMWMYTSQADELINVTSSDKNMLIRVKIPTEHIYNIGEITKIAFWVYHYRTVDKTEHSAYKEWNLNSTTILKSYQWNDNGWGKDYITRGSSYSNKKIAPKLSSYDGSINIYSKVRNSNSETDCGKKYFTGSDGEIKVDINKSLFFSTKTRIPTNLYFEGIDKDDKPLNRWIDLASNELVDGATSKTFNSDKIGDWKRIDKAYLCFGEDKINKILFKIFLNGFFNSDVSDNIKIDFTQTTGVSNQIITTPERDSNNNKHKMQSVVTGEISLDSSYPFEFSQKNSSSQNCNPYFCRISLDNNQLTQIDQEIISNQYKMTNTSLKIDYIKEYEITEEIIENSKQINFLDNCALKAGKYTIKCQVNKKLKTKKTSGIEEHTFTFSQNKEIKITANPNYLVFGGELPSINYYIPNSTGEKVGVDGTIIIPNENLDFILNSNNLNFRVYSSNPASNNDQKPIKTYYLPHYIGLHKDYYQEDVTAKRTTQTSIPYNTIKGWLNNPNEQKAFYISYIFNYGEETIYTPPFKYIFGRVEKPIYDGLKVEEQKIKYFLTDNGSDQITSLDNKKSQNDFIEKRKKDTSKNGDFSMSRNITDVYTKERLQLVICRDEETIGQVFIKINKNNPQARQNSIPTLNDIEYSLNNALDLLKTGQVNEIDFSDLITYFTYHKVDLKSSPFDLKIILEYMYNEEISQELFKIELKNINFSPDVIPIGLRNGGVIINPKDNGNEQLNTKDKEGKKDTFVINVNQVQKTEAGNEAINGLKITFNIPKTLEDGKIELETKTTFEIYLDERGIVHLSNCVIDPAPTTET